MTSVIHTFLVDEFSETYPYLPFNCSNDYARMHQDSRPRASVLIQQIQIPFFCFSGPDPPPANIGSLGDLYVAPTASALYAYLPSDDLFEDGSWTRWSATRPTDRTLDLAPGDPGLLQHPYFPDRVLWAFTTSFSWFRLDSVNRMMRTVPPSWYRDSEDTVTATKTMVDQTVLGQKEQYRLLEEMTLKRSREEDAPKARKKVRVTGGTKPNAAARVAELEAENGALKASLEEGRRTHAAEVKSLDTQLSKHLATIAGLIAGLKKNTAQAASVERLAATITHLDAEKAASSVTVKEVLLENEALKAYKATATVRIVDLEAENGALTASLQEHRRLHAAEVGTLQTSFDTTVNVLKDDKAAMRALLGKPRRAVALTRPEAKKSEVLRDNETLKVKTPAMQQQESQLIGKMVQTDNTRMWFFASSIPLLKKQSSIQLLQTQQALLASQSSKLPSPADSAQRTAHYNNALQAAESTIQGLRETTKVLLAEIDRVSDATAAACLAERG
ncbi:hypothetical protein DFH08DRAFT_963405 [Mycena albidolilacea]|uniref:Uncharacterized protein n=1 Tax=Mycena albidolilacea TaxID=1033008 RepID=A0AAD7EN76_9AGAR|nr:hypothetical protein DFH08DRAFT_963405 [Mycena albidolilacea]